MGHRRQTARLYQHLPLPEKPVWTGLKTGLMRVPVQEFEVDSAILAVGINGMKKIVAGSKALQQPDFRRVNNLGSVDVLAGKIHTLNSRPKAAAWKLRDMHCGRMWLAMCLCSPS